MNREANTIKINLGTAEFRSEEGRKAFLKALNNTHFVWVRQMISKAEGKNGKYEKLTMDLNDPPFAKDISFMENAEKLMETLAEAADAEVRKAVVHSIYANCKTLSILLNDEEKNIREIAEKRLSGTSNMWASKSGRISTAFFIDKNIFWMYNWYSFYIKVFGIWCRSYLSNYLEFYTGSYGQQTESHTREAI